MKTIISSALIPVLLLLFSSLQAETGQMMPVEQQSALSGKITDLKEQVLELNRDLFILEEELLFPVNTQVSVFISMDAGNLFELDAVQLKLNDKIVSNYLYTLRELGALQRGGVQRLYIGNLPSGEHELTAFFVGKGPSGRDYKRATTKEITKSDEALYVELKIQDDVSKEQPGFTVKVWE